LNKRSIERLAIFDGPPLFAAPLYVGSPNIGDKKRILARIEDILDRRVLTNRGPLVQELEARVADLVGVKHCIAMSNGTVALEIVTRALGMKNEVITPSMTFVATAHALQWQRITPVFCDVRPGSHHMDPSQIRNLITPRTTGLLPVNLWGRPCSIDAIQSVAGSCGLSVVYDSSHAFGCSYQGRMIGGFGNAEVFSFHATKFINTFEGGAVVTNDGELAEKVRLMQNFGFEGRDRVSHIGINGKMTEVEAAMGLESLDCMADFVEANRANYQAYRQGFQSTPGLQLIEYDERERCNYQYIVVEIDKRITGISRDDLLRVLAAENIDARRYFYPGCHRMEPYRSYFPNAHMLLEHTEQTLDRTLALPTGTAVYPEQVQEITHLINDVLGMGAALTARLKQAAIAAPEEPEPCAVAL
jgi:dTDP-4-amino-4,6-dideoxygalactose transaminase